MKFPNKKSNISRTTPCWPELRRRRNYLSSGQRGRQAQQGVIGWIILLVLPSFAIGTTIWLTQEYTSKKIIALPDERRQYLDSLKTAIERWYQNNVRDVETKTYRPEEIWTAINIESKWGAQILVSNSILRDSVSGRKILIYLPKFGVSASEQGLKWDTTTGDFMLGTSDEFRLVDGLQIQREKVQLTRQRLQRIASLIINRARAKYELDPARDQSVNYMRDEQCGTNENIECIDQWKAIDQTNAVKLLGIHAHSSEILDLWGNTLEIENLKGSKLAPWSLSLRATPPWNSAQSLEVLAIQQLD